MTDDRRKDVGMKIMVGIFIGLVGLLSTLFVNAAWVTANDGKRMGEENSKNIAVINANYENFSRSIIDIKLDIKEILRRSQSNDKRTMDKE
jgi:hypothetical protein